MATTYIPNNLVIEPRKSTETEDRRYLLADSIAPSESASMIYDIEGEGDRTPRARSPNRASGRPASLRSVATTVTTSYRGFPSEAEYIAALEQWADQYRYNVPEKALIGFFGKNTAEELASRPAPQIGLRKKLRERKERKVAKQEERRNTVA